MRLPESFREWRIDEVIKARGIGIELRVIFRLHRVFHRHVRLEAVDLDMREPGLSKRGDVLLTIELTRAAPVLREAAIPMRTMPWECYGQK